MRCFLRVLIAIATMGTLTASAATFTVTNTNATGAGSLQDAINQANGDLATDTIAFNIAGGGVHVITQHAFAINTPMVIDATTQPGFAGAPLIEIDGSASFVIFFVNATATIRGFSLVHFREAIHVGSNAVNSTIAGNYIGVDPDGATANGGLFGITISDFVAGVGDTHLIGGASPADRNVISGNFSGVLANGTVGIVSVQGNFIGTQADGSTALPNDTGIHAAGPAVVNVGGLAPNAIAHNTTNGVRVASGPARIVSNSFFANGTGIDDVFPGNANTETPVLTSATTTAASSQVSGTLSVPIAPSTQFLIEFFSNPVSENQGRTLLGQTFATTDGAGNASFNATLGPLTPGIFVTATATNNSLSETSEFATNIPAVALTANLSITKTTTATSVNAGDFIDYTITVTNGGPDSATGVTVADALPPNTTFVSATPTQGSCSGGPTVNCSIGTLTNGASATIALRVTATAAGNATNTASATANEMDPDGANAAAPAVTIANPMPIPTLSPALLLVLAAMLAAIALVRK